MTKANRVVALVLASCIFFGIGIVSSMWGPVLPDLAKNTGSTLGVTGSLFTSLFLGALLTQFSLGPLNDHVGPRLVLVASLFVAAAGLVAVSLSPSLFLALISIFFLGTGTGAMIVGTNVMVASVFASRSVSALSFANLFYGVGAVFGPAIASFAARQWGSHIGGLWFAAALLALLSPAALLLKVPRATPGAVTQGTVPISIYRTPVLWIFGAVLLLYVGTEAATTSWSLAYMSRTTGMTPDDAALALSGFWLALTCGRLVGAVVGSWVGARTLLALCIAGATASISLMLLSGGSAPLMVAGLVSLGFAVGPIYSSVVALTTGTFVDQPGKAASFVIAMGSVGGMIIPWLLGALLEWGGTYVSLAALLACATGMLALLLAPRLTTRHLSADAVAAP